MNQKEQTEVERLRLENAALRAQLKPQFAATPYGMMPVSIASMERLSASITGLTKRLALAEADVQCPACHSMLRKTLPLDIERVKIEAAESAVANGIPKWARDNLQRAEAEFRAEGGCKGCGSQILGVHYQSGCDF